MEEKFKLQFFIKIFSFILLTWINHFNNNMSSFNKYLDEKYDNIRKLGQITYRLLAKRKQMKRPYTIWINDVIPNNGKYIKKDIYNNEKINEEKNILADKVSLKSAENYKLPRRNESSMYIRGNLYCKKRIFDKIYYKNIVRNSWIKDFISLKEDIKLKLLGIFILGSFHVLVGITLIVLGKLGYLDDVNNVIRLFNKIGLFVVLFYILTFVVAVAMLFIQRRVVKYLKALEKKYDINNTAYPSLRKVVKYNK
ncbi:Plasmodium exported protein, unknown function [Plasmodium malariae]|uniref:Fam-m protein n=1 Tax=Plasmodium malariae TaxID=5858 RepID=A0A1D3JHW1_PLAMA|nr:Plasmodium exported protein, unknown function [Plasmodium malariae]SBT86025.1 Plasmodium exported protein, unknown function [Plasmodium malariae]